MTKDVIKSNWHKYSKHIIQLKWHLGLILAKKSELNVVRKSSSCPNMTPGDPVVSSVWVCYSNSVFDLNEQEDGFVL